MASPCLGVFRHKPHEVVDIVRHDGATHSRRIFQLSRITAAPRSSFLYGQYIVAGLSQFLHDDRRDHLIEQESHRDFLALCSFLTRTTEMPG